MTPPSSFFNRYALASKLFEALIEPGCATTYPLLTCLISTLSITFLHFHQPVPYPQTYDTFLIYTFSNKGFCTNNFYIRILFYRTFLNLTCNYSTLPLTANTLSIDINKGSVKTRSAALYTHLPYSLIEKQYLYPFLSLPFLLKPYEQIQKLQVVRRIAICRY